MYNIKLCFKLINLCDDLSLYWLFIIVCIKYDHVPRRHVFIIKDQVSFDQVLALFHVTLYWSFVFVCIKIHWMHAVDYTKENHQLSTLVERWITGSQRWIHISFLLSFFYLSLFHPGDFSYNSKIKEKNKLLIYITFSFFFFKCSSELSSSIKKKCPWVILKQVRIYTLKFQN